MGISGHTTRFLAAEHRYRPFPEVVHLLGRQTIYVLAQARTVLEAEGVKPCDVVEEFDLHTLEALHQAKARAHPLISDTSFFQLFGTRQIRAIDHSSYEGADIVFDLNREAPREHWGIADLIFDGSVMDNIFSPSEAIQNVSRMLRLGGRYVGIAVGCTKIGAYLGFNPYWFFDYFVANWFRDVRVYVAEYDQWEGALNYADTAVYMLDPDASHRSAMQFVGDGGLSVIFVVAEKDERSTADARASQAIYRLDGEWREFDASLERVRASTRPRLSLRKHCDRETLGGYGFTVHRQSHRFRHRRSGPKPEVSGVRERGDRSWAALCRL